MLLPHPKNYLEVFLQACFLFVIFSFISLINEMKWNILMQWIVPLKSPWFESPLSFAFYLLAKNQWYPALKKLIWWDPAAAVRFEPSISLLFVFLYFCCFSFVLSPVNFFSFSLLLKMIIHVCLFRFLFVDSSPSILLF